VHLRTGRRALWQELPFLAMIAVILAVMVKAFVVQAYYIPSRSMVPTLDIGDRVLVNRTAYRFGTPQHGQVAVFIRPDSDAARPAAGVAGATQRMLAKAFGNAPPGTEDLIKRVIGRPGDVVAARGGKLFRNGREVNEPYLEPGTVTSTFGPVRVPPDSLWMMGDNREDSADSRTFGPIRESDLVGRAVVLIWPFDNAGSL
jgi:signal peptidase I